MLETKPGYQTTEFWIAIFTNVLGILQLNGVDVISDLGSSNNKYVVIGLALVNGLYAVGRGQAKQGIPHAPTAAPAEGDLGDVPAKP